MKSSLRNLIIRHDVSDEDWMDFKITKKNSLTYHHIKKKCEKGKKTVNNGAPLTKSAHHFLHYLERKEPELYREWNILFGEINQSGEKPTEEMKEKQRELRKKGSIIENKKRKW